ncbi:hypothetical protein BC827DRAFT_1189690 [Russula dissimulans]|nr:hypothetical protein BC827DRAFT_1189690 [Russula dissimulans]
MSTSDNTSTQERSTRQGLQVALDESLYNLTDEERAFFKQQTGIQDDDELKAHIVQVQAEAYKIHPYPCIRYFFFTKLKISRLFPYQDLLKIGKQRNEPIFLDIGSCFGNDARKAIADGYPLGYVITSDLHPEFADLGHKLFRTTPGTYPIAFIPGDAFDPKHLEIVPPLPTANAPIDTAGPAPDLRSLTSLNPLHGRASAIHASSLFHLFGEEKQLHLARALAGLLSPEPGSVIFGLHLGLAEKGFTKPEEGVGHRLFCHSPVTWAELWESKVFEKGVVNVQTKLVQVAGKFGIGGDQASTQTTTLLIWSITRL